MILFDFQLEKAVGYEIRRRIRAQIRVVKRLISENKLPKTTGAPPKTDRWRSPEKSKNEKHYTEYQTKYTRKSSPETKRIDNKLFGHTDIISQKDTSEKITEYQTSYKWDERRSSLHSQVTTSSRSRSGSPPTKITQQQKPKPFQPAPASKPNQGDDKPEWVTQRSLKKVTTSKAPTTTSTKVSSSSSSKKTTTESYRKTTNSANETKDTDVITSSYGVGPLDENGTPLFGLKALRARSKGDQTKGTMLS